jgi:hypothetical protein
MLATESHDSDAYDIIDGIINGIFDNNDNNTGKDNNNSNQDDEYFNIFSDNYNVDRDAEEEEDDEKDNYDGYGQSELDDNFHHKFTTNNDLDEAVDQHVVVEDRYEVGDHHVLDNERNMMYDDTHVMIDDRHREGGDVVTCGEGDDHDSDYNPSR